MELAVTETRILEKLGDGDVTLGIRRLIRVTPYSVINSYKYKINSAEEFVSTQLWPNCNSTAVPFKTIYGLYSDVTPPLEIQGKMAFKRALELGGYRVAIGGANVLKIYNVSTYGDDEEDW